MAKEKKPYYHKTEYYLKSDESKEPTFSAFAIDNDKISFGKINSTTRRLFIDVDEFESFIKNCNLVEKE